ncbi:hypothetical protein F5148DRAFT_1151251 [Russula earlei]|uniref:Uncharacterized protein n=1 Tax=Russula earlei TaxID=71964 RepID=A0ACC0U1H0_9AGAM|nr:hypothetical protein F5148DRAFT_1151251 [Russula earlei]
MNRGWVLLQVRPAGVRLKRERGEVMLALTGTSTKELRWAMSGGAGNELSAIEREEMHSTALDELAGRPFQLMERLPRHLLTDDIVRLTGTLRSDGGMKVSKSVISLLSHLTRLALAGPPTMQPFHVSLLALAISNAIPTLAELESLAFSAYHRCLASARDGAALRRTAVLRRDKLLPAMNPEVPWPLDREELRFFYSDHKTSQWQLASVDRNGSVYKSRNDRKVWILSRKAKFPNPDPKPVCERHASTTTYLFLPSSIQSDLPELTTCPPYSCLTSTLGGLKYLSLRPLLDNLQESAFELRIERSVRTADRQPMHLVDHVVKFADIGTLVVEKADTDQHERRDRGALGGRFCHNSTTPAIIDPTLQAEDEYTRPSSHGTIQWNGSRGSRSIVVPIEIAPIVHPPVIRIVDWLSLLSRDVAAMEIKTKSIPWRCLERVIEVISRTGSVPGSHGVREERRASLVVSELLGRSKRIAELKINFHYVVLAVYTSPSRTVHNVLKLSLDEARSRQYGRIQGLQGWSVVIKDLRQFLGMYWKTVFLALGSDSWVDRRSWGALIGRLDIMASPVA